MIDRWDAECPPREERSPLRVLFICKHRMDSGGSGYDCHSGLRASVEMVVAMLVEQLGLEAKVVDVVDNNDIDRETHDYRPDVVILEALWVVPEKFDELISLHPFVTWCVRVHSEVPFLASEGIATAWLAGYLDRGVLVAFNSERTANDYRGYDNATHMRGGLIRWLPNYYPPVRVRWMPRPVSPAPYPLWVGCFGAIRPMKNQMIQAQAAIALAHRRRQPLQFFINAGRVEMGGEAVLQNIRGLFAHRGPDYRLMELPWLPRREFLEWCSWMDLGMQVSLSESYNMVAANLVSVGTPVVASTEVRFIAPRFQAKATDVRDIVRKAERALAWAAVPLNAWRLNRSSIAAKRQWRDALVGTQDLGL